MAEISVNVTRLAHAQDLALPAYATALSAGADLVALPTWRDTFGLALVEALARLLYEAEKRRERTSRLRDPDR